MQGVVLDDVVPPWVQKRRKRPRLAALIVRLRALRATQWQCEMPSWTVSVLVHVALLAVFAMFSASAAHPRATVELDSRALDVPEERVAMDAFDPGLTASADVTGEGARSMSDLVAETLATAPELKQRLPEAPITLPDTFDPLKSLEFTSTLRVAGSFAEHTAGTQGAVDRLTVEILRSLQQGKTLVAWLLDASGSLTQEREALAKRFDRVYSDLGHTGKTNDRALITGIVSFGTGVHFLTEEPTDDVEATKKAVRSVVVDEDGVENVFGAVHATAQRWLKYRKRERRNFMMIVLTDEVGDDAQRMEAALDITRRHGISVFVVGIPALFGRQTGYLPWKDPNGGMHQIEVKLGPETLRPERVNIPFWGGAARDADRFSSGFGPFALTRLCRETGGVYFITRGGEGPQFDPLALKSYQPDYMSPREYDQLLNQSRARAAVVRVAQAGPTNVVVPRVEFPAMNEGVLAQALGGAQRSVALLEARLTPMIDELSRAEADRAKLQSARWRASFDLAMGRVLANFVRAREYNSVLARMKQGLKFENPQNNHWRLKPGDALVGGSRLEKFAERAKAYLNRVVDEHPNTPWSWIAEKELSQPFGWQWDEYYVAVNPPGQNRPGAPNRPNNPPPNRPQPKPFKIPKF